jgi:TolA-binding protein
MSDPRRLLGGEANEFEKELLRSWEAEQPSDAARAGLLAAVGIGAGAAAAAAAKVGAAAGGSIAPKAAATVSALVVAKWAAVVVGIAAVGATVGYVRHASRVRQAIAVPSSMPAAAAAPSPMATAAAPVDPPSDAPIGATVDTPSGAPHARTTDPHAKPSVHARPSALGEQVTALDSARRALAAGNAASTLQQLDDYETRFPNGALVEEAEVLRVEALLAEGDRASASHVGERFLSAHPNSPHASRVRALLASP